MKFNRSNNFKTIYKIVKKAIDDFNPYYLLPEAPNDEFDIESNKIACKITFESTPDEIVLIISDVLSRSFDKRLTIEVCMETANIIYEEMILKCPKRQDDFRKVKKLLNDIIDGNTVFTEEEKLEIIEYVENNENGIALETICGIILENKLTLNKDLYEKIINVGMEMDMDSNLWNKIDVIK